MTRHPNNLPQVAKHNGMVMFAVMQKKAQWKFIL